MKRVLVVFAIVGCGRVDHHPITTQCPDRQDGAGGDTVVGSPCDGDGTCFVLDEFSPCASAFYRCIDGAFVYDRGLDAMDGASCLDSPVATCSVEGNDCSAEPTGQICSCGADGAWHCVCRCYSDFGSDCGACPATFQNVTGIQCGPIANVCDYPDGHHCDCVDVGGGVGMFQCN